MLQVIDKENKPYIQVEVTNKKQDFVTEEISAMILVEIKKEAENFLGCRVQRAVITVPAYFTDAQRQATKDAGEIAGLSVERIINEPTAAALAYGLHKTKETENLLIYDLGGGTFDVSLLRMIKGDFTVLATNGDTHLGGEDFDRRILEYALASFKQKSDSNSVIITDRGIQRLRREIEKAKRRLSNDFTTTISVENIVPGKHFSMSLSRAKFEELNDELFKSTLLQLAQVLEDAKLSKKDITKIVLVGGSTRIPKIRQLVKEFFNGKPLYDNINPDEAIAYGAAVQAYLLSGKNDTGITLTDVNPLSLGIQIEDGISSVIIPRNSQIPIKITQNYRTLEEYQTVATIRVFEGERILVKDNNLLGEFLIDGFAPTRFAYVDVTFEIDSNGILNVTATDIQNGNTKSIVISGQTRLSEEQIERHIVQSQRFAEEDKKTEHQIQARTDFEGYIEMKRELLKNYDMKNLTLFGELSGQQIRLATAKLEEEIIWLRNNRKVSAGEFLHRKKELDRYFYWTVGISFPFQNYLPEHMGDYEIVFFRLMWLVSIIAIFFTIRNLMPLYFGSGRNAIAIFFVSCVLFQLNQMINNDIVARKYAEQRGRPYNCFIGEGAGKTITQFRNEIPFYEFLGIGFVGYCIVTNNPIQLILRSYFGF
uniref:Uncharacterized protein n=1 Tax=Panagrolaimus davidi TaxID=227884 RepID=A0A914QTS8_9BILA